MLLSLSMPPDPASLPSSLRKWVERLRHDIASRGLSPGEPYLTSRAASELLGCSRATAHRAMAQLAAEGLLVARQGSGMFIGEIPSGPPPVQTLLVALARGFAPCTAMPLIGMLQRAAAALGNLGVQFNVFPADAPLHYVTETLVRPFHAGQVAAVVAVGCHWSVQQHLRESGVKALVLGSPFPDRLLLDAMDKDSVGAGWLLVDHLVARGHQRIGVVAPASGLAGVDLLVDAIAQRFAHHQLPAAGLTLRFCNGDEPVTLDRVREMLSGRQAPTAVITSEEDSARQVESVAQGLGLRVPEELEIVFEGSLLRTGQPSPYGHTHTDLDDDALLHELVQRLRSLRVLQPGDDACSRLYEVAFRAGCQTGIPKAMS